MIQLHLPGRPLAWKAPYVGTRGAFSVRTPVMDQYRAILRKQLNDLWVQEGDLNWFCKPVSVDLVYYMGIPQATSKKQREKMLRGEIRPGKRPDVGNLLKLTHDVLQDVIFDDDALIVDGRAAKYYSEQESTVIKIYLADEYESIYGRLNDAAQERQKP